MNLKSTWETAGRILFCSMALSLPLSSAGCGQTACIAWSADEGACPAQSSAFSFFSDPACPSSILSVDSEGAFANNLCCYAVTKQESADGPRRCGRAIEGGTGGLGGDTVGSSDGGPGTSSGGGLAATCIDYCMTIMANCNANHQQWTTAASCLRACAAFPQGNSSDPSGNSLECRIAHANAARTAPDTYCAHAGPTGGARSGAAADEGPCGNGCEAFCEIQAQVCVGAAQQYKDSMTCMVECQTFKPNTATYSVANIDKDDFGCRMYHLSLAANDEMTATIQCPHTIASSSVCTK